MHWLLLALAIGVEILGTTALKASDGFSDWRWSILSVLCYGLSLFLLAKVLRHIPVGVAYAIWSGVGIGAIALIGWMAFGQTLNTPALAGIGLIITGVVVLNIYSGTMP